MMPGVCVRALRIIDEESLLGELVILNWVRSTRSSQATCFPQHTVILPVWTFQMRKRLLIISKQNQITPKQLLKLQNCLFVKSRFALLFHFVKIC